MTGAPIVLAVAAAAFAALALRLDGLVATFVGGYLVLVGQVAALIWLLSPFDAVTLAWLTVGEAVIAVVAATAWAVRGRPLPSTAAARTELRAILGDPLTVAFAVLAVVGLAYELVLALTVPPNNWDSLTYHLARVAGWHQAHGVHWIPNAPTGRINEFQPLAEQLILFLFVAGSTALYALPQYVAQLAILVAVYGAARRLGYEPRAAARGTALVAMLSLVALEATTAQNDLVAASAPIAAAYFLLGAGALEPVLAGFAVAVGLGTKLTTALSLPVLVYLAWRRGRQALAFATAGGILGLATVGCWGYVLNVVHTGRLLGHGQGRVENSAATTFAGTAARFGHLVYRLFDLSVATYWPVAVFGAAGCAVAALLAVRRPTRLAPLAAAPLFAPVVALAVLDLFALDPAYVARTASEDVSGFGPVGTAALIGAPIFAVVSRRAWRRDRRVVAFAVALPIYMVLLAAFARYNIWICRFLVVPVVLTAPLFSSVCRNRVAGAALLALGAFTLVVALTYDTSKELGGNAGRPWTLSQLGALRAFSAQPTGTIVARSLAAYERAVPGDACVGAVVDPDEPSYLLWGPRLRRRVLFLPSLDALRVADANALRYVVVSTGVNAPVSQVFAQAGWRVRRLGSYWQLAVAPRGAADVCRAG